MLQELARYAEKQRLPGLPGYKTKPVKWVVVLTEDGQYVDTMELEQNQFYHCPDLAQNQLGPGKLSRSHFLVASTSVVTLFGAKSEEVEKHACFVELLHKAAADCLPLELCARLLENEDVTKQINTTLETRKAKPTHYITFQVGQRLALEMPEWRSWWQVFRSRPAASNPDTSRMICLLTGEVVTPALTHNLKVSLPKSVGGLSMGSVLIGFDKEAFRSYGLVQSANAACVEEAAATYATALNDLIRQAPPPLGGALMLHWYSEKIPDEDDLFPDMMSFGDESNAASARNKARELLTAVRAGKRPELTQNRYFVLQVSGSGGRVMVRDWFTGDFVRLVESVNAWYDALEIIKPHGGEIAEPPKLARLLIRLVSYRPGEEAKDLFKRINTQLAPFLPKLWRAILQGGPLPDTTAQFALAHARSRLLREDDEQATGNLDWIACAILKAWLVRQARLNAQEQNDMEAKVNKDHPATAYHIGRVVAVFAKLQRDALPDVGAGVVQRYFASASTTPALVLYRLVRNAQYHLDKLDNKGLIIWYERQIAEIMTRLGDAVPSTLDLEGQTLFTLGYYQQQAEMYSGAKSDKDSTQANEGGK